MNDFIFLHEEGKGEVSVSLSALCLGFLSRETGIPKHALEFHVSVLKLKNQLISASPTEESIPALGIIT